MNNDNTAFTLDIDLSEETLIDLTTMVDEIDNLRVLRYFKWVSQIRACLRRDRSWRCNCERIDSLAPVYAPVGSCC